MKLMMVFVTWNSNSSTGVASFQPTKSDNYIKTYIILNNIHIPESSIIFFIFIGQLMKLKKLHENALQYDCSNLMSVSDFQFPNNIPHR
jgi:hypothetical protein